MYTVNCKLDSATSENADTSITIIHASQWQACFDWLAAEYKSMDKTATLKPVNVVEASTGETVMVWDSRDSEMLTIAEIIAKGERIAAEMAR